MREYNFTVVVSGLTDREIINKISGSPSLKADTRNFLLDYKKEAASFKDAVMAVVDEIEPFGGKVEQVWK